MDLVLWESNQLRKCNSPAKIQADMFKDKNPTPMASSSSNETIIAQGVKVEGDFHSEGDVSIDGEVTGSVETKQALNIGATARIQADVAAKSAVVAGEVQGNIKAVENLELLATSKVHGDITTERISVAPGALLNGRVTMSTSKKVPKQEAPLDE